MFSHASPDRLQIETEKRDPKEGAREKEVNTFPCNMRLFMDPCAVCLCRCVTAHNIFQLRFQRLFMLKGCQSSFIEERDFDISD